MKIAVLIPALDAAATIAPIVTEALRHADLMIVVDDGSSDGTSEAARRAGALIVRHSHNRGKGSALKTGFARALQEGADAVVTLDADGQHLVADIPRFVETWKETGADLIIGSRQHLFSGMVRRRRLANRFSAWSISIASGVRLTDSQSGFRLYSGHMLGLLSGNAGGFDFESEIIVRAGRRGFRIIEIPVTLGFVDGVATSHYRPVLDTLRIAGRVIRTALRP
jgi:glycosyltransferase involved in cell wall biosynthesis